MPMLAVGADAMADRCFASARCRCWSIFARRFAAVVGVDISSAPVDESAVEDIALSGRPVVDTEADDAVLGLAPNADDPGRGPPVIAAAE